MPIFPLGGQSTEVAATTSVNKATERVKRLFDYKRTFTRRSFFCKSPSPFRIFFARMRTQNMPIQSSFLSIGEQKVHYLQLGEEKKCLLFLHGWGGSAESFRHFFAPIHALGFSVMAIDFPSFGLSSPAPESGWDSADYAVFVEQFLEKFPQKEWYIFAHSFGGRVACRLLFSRPNAAKKLILAGAAGIAVPLGKRQKIAQLLSKLFSFGKYILGTRITSYIGAKLSGSHDWADADAGEKASLKKVFAEKDFRNQLPQIPLPVLLLWGAQDSYTPLFTGKIFQSKLPSATLKIFHDGRHGIHKTHPEEIIGYLKEFL